MPYLLEAMVLVEEGVPVTAIDRAAEAFGMPMGPLSLADTVGLDICLSVAQQLSQALNNAVPENLKMRVDAGDLGRKSGQGFYCWQSGRPVKPPANDEQPLSDRDISDRLPGSALMNYRGFTRQLESSYRDIWRAWCADAPVGQTD